MGQARDAARCALLAVLGEQEPCTSAAVLGEPFASFMSASTVFSPAICHRAAQTGERERIGTSGHEENLYHAASPLHPPDQRPAASVRQCRATAHQSARRGELAGASGTTGDRAARRWAARASAAAAAAAKNIYACMDLTGRFRSLHSLPFQNYE